MIPVLMFCNGGPVRLHLCRRGGWAICRDGAVLEQTTYEAGVHEAVDAMRGLEAEEPGGADNFNFLLDFLATFLEFFPTFRETVACLARLHAYSATIICKLILARRP